MPMRTFEYRVKSLCWTGVGAKVPVISLSEPVEMRHDGLETALEVTTIPQTLRDTECRRINCLYWPPELVPSHNTLTGLTHE